MLKIATQKLSKHCVMKATATAVKTFWSILQNGTILQQKNIYLDKH